MPIALWSWARGTTRGIIDPSAGVSATLARLTPRLSASSIGTFAPATASPAVRSARAMFGTTSAQRRSSRSTTTPANGDKMICGQHERGDECPDGGVRARRVEDQHRQRVERHVAADLGGGLDEPQPREDRVAQDRPRGRALRHARTLRCRAMGDEQWCGRATLVQNEGSRPHRRRLPYGSSQVESGASRAGEEEFHRCVVRFCPVWRSRAH